MFKLHIAKDNLLMTVPGINRDRQEEQANGVFKVKYTQKIFILVLNQYGQSELNYTSTIKRMKGLYWKFEFCASGVNTACSPYLHQYLSVQTKEAITHYMLVLHSSVVSTNKTFITDLYNQMKFSTEPLIVEGINNWNSSAILIWSKLTFSILCFQ